MPADLAARLRLPVHSALTSIYPRDKKEGITLQIGRGNKHKPDTDALGAKPSAFAVPLRQTLGSRNSKKRSSRVFTGRWMLLLAAALSASFILWSQLPKVQNLNRELSNAVKAYLSQSSADERPASLASAKVMANPALPPVLPPEPGHKQTVYSQTKTLTQVKVDKGTIGSELTDAESLVSAIPKKIESLAELMDVLNAGDVAGLNVDVINDYIAESTEAFDYISSEYLATENQDLKNKLRIVLDNANNPEKLDLAMELANSDRQDERETAYSWLMQAEQLDSPEVYNTLIDALEKDDNAGLYTGLISSLSSYGVAQDPQARDRLLSRLESLSLYSEEKTAAAALSKMVEISQGKKTLALLHAHITSSPLDLKIAAIQELPRINNPSRELLAELNTIMHNPSAPQSLRQASVMSIVALENQGLAFE